MSSALTNKFNREKIQQLLAAVGSRPTEDTTQIEATEYDWRQPHYFSSSQLKKLDDFTKKTAAMLTKKFTDLCHSSFNVTVASTTQHYADEFLGQTPESKNDDYHLAFGADRNHLCGIISIPSQTAATLVTQLLGDSESEKDSDKAFSQLEESLLLDIACAIVEILSGSYDNYDFHPTGSIVKGQLPIELRGTEELCRITFNVKKADSENSSEARLLISCETLDSIVGKTLQAAGVFSAEDISKAVLDRLQEMPISVTARLGSVMLNFEEVMSLQADDILLLDKAIDEPVELIADGRVLFHGQVAKSTGRYAMVITKLCDTE